MVAPSGTSVDCATKEIFMTVFIEIVIFVEVAVFPLWSKQDTEYCVVDTSGGVV